jgi:hypothetical protein
MRQLIYNGNDSIRDVVNRALRGADEETILAVGNFELLYRNLRNARLDFKNPRPYLFEELKLSRSLSTTCTNQPFYRYGIGNYGNLEANEDILIFYSNNMMQKLRENLTWAVDGTFHVVPSPYFQLYTVSFIKDFHVYLVIFALLKIKRLGRIVNCLN